MGRAPPPRMSSSSCCGTRSPSCAAPTHDHAWTGRTGPCSRSSSGGCPRALRCHHLVIPNTILRWHSRLVVARSRNNPSPSDSIRAYECGLSQLAGKVHPTTRQSNAAARSGNSAIIGEAARSRPDVHHRTSGRVGRGSRPRAWWPRVEPGTVSISVREAALATARRAAEVAGGLI